MPVAMESTTSAKLQTPAGDRQSLVFPSFQTAPDLLVDNHMRLQAANSKATDATILGTLLPEFAAAAKQELLKLAEEYTGTYLPLEDTVQRTPTPQIVLSGHQPELFHAGVWFKNFALHRIASDAADSAPTVGIHLLIDNDLVQAPGVTGLTGPIESPRTTRISMDADPDGGPPSRPYEERAIQDVDHFKSFGQRVIDTIRPFVDRPLISSLWDDAAKACAKNNNLGECISQARHQMEYESGLRNLEVPLSRICDGNAFAQFLAEILSKADSFCHEYNDAIVDYRREKKLRSQSHPAPLLLRSEQWIELPFWSWTSATPLRQPVFLKLGSGPTSQPATYQLTIGDPTTGADEFTLPDADGSDVAKLRSTLQRRGIKIRPRALITTMFARLFLSDLFLHGIGGAKYDVVTDRLIERFFGIDPPHYMAVSATFRLPISNPLVEQDDIRQINGLLRELQYHPETIDSRCESFPALQREKMTLVRSIPQRGERLDWHRRLEKLNLQMAQTHSELKEQLLSDREQLANSLRNQRLLGSREYSFCFFPAEKLTADLLELSRST